MGNVSIEENIRILEQGITLQQFSGMQEQLAIDGSMDAYNEYGMYVVHNKTQNVYLIDGGIPQHFYESFGDTEEEKKTYYDFLKEKFCSDEYETVLMDYRL